MTAALAIPAVVATDCVARATLTLACASAVDATPIAKRAGRVLRAVFPEVAAPLIMVDGGDDHGAILNVTPAPLVAIIGANRFTLGVDGALADRASLELLAAAVLGASAVPDRVVDIDAWRAGFEQDTSSRAVEARHWWHARVHPSPDLPFAADSEDGLGADPASHVLPPALAADLNALAERHGWQAETPLLAAWLVIVTALADAPCTVWTNCNGRGFEGLADCVGALAHPLPVSCRLEPGTDARTLLARVDSDLRSARDRQDYAPEPTAGAIGFHWHRAVTLVDGDGHDWVEVSRGEAWPVAAPCLEFAAHGSQVRLRLHGPVAEHDAKRVVDIVVAFLKALASDPCQSWESLLPSAPPHPPDPRPADRDILTDIARWVAHSPEAAAVVDEFGRLSYAQLWRRAGAVATRLRAFGAGPERPVGLVAGRSVAAVVALLAAWRAGAPYLPLDPSHPDARLSRLLDAAGVVAIVADPQSGARAECWGRPIVLATDEESECLQRAGDEVPCVATAYLIATSGSTGAFKLVAVERRQLAAYRDALVEALAVGDGRRFAMVTGWATDLGLTMLVAALTTGGALHVLPSAALLQAPAFAAFIQGHGVEIVKTTPGHLAGLLAQPAGARVLPSRLVILGGEPLPRALVD
ncbi:MAG TPA: AMP-binding protein, partial [Allosphingosinicella sp.]